MDGSEFQGSFKWNMSSESLLNQSLELSKHTVLFFFFSFSFFPITFQLQDPQGRDCLIQVSAVRLGVS